MGGRSCGARGASITAVNRPSWGMDTRGTTSGRTWATKAAVACCTQLQAHPLPSQQSKGVPVSGAGGDGFSGVCSWQPAWAGAAEAGGLLAVGVVPGDGAADIGIGIPADTSPLATKAKARTTCQRRRVAGIG